MGQESPSRGRSFWPSCPRFRYAAVLPIDGHSMDYPTTNDYHPHVRVHSRDPSSAESDLDVSQFNRHLFEGFASGIASILTVHLDRLAQRLTQVR